MPRSIPGPTSSKDATSTPAPRRSTDNGRRSSFVEERLTTPFPTAFSSELGLSTAVAPAPINQAHAARARPRRHGAAGNGSRAQGLRRCFPFIGRPTGRNRESQPPVGPRGCSRSRVLGRPAMRGVRLDPAEVPNALASRVDQVVNRCAVSGNRAAEQVRGRAELPARDREVGLDERSRTGRHRVAS